MTDESGKALCYRAVCNTCGGLLGATVITQEHVADTAKYVGRWVRAGLRVDTVTAQEIREGTWCKCARAARVRPRPELRQEVRQEETQSPQRV